MGKKTGDAALATALDYVRQIRKTPIVVNDCRGFYANRCVMAYILEGHLMLAEGVPPAMIENVAQMAGMPVGPLSLTDEIGVDLAWKILQATKKDGGTEIIIAPEQEKLLEEMVVKRERFGRKNGKGFYDYAGRDKALWPGLAELVHAEERRRLRRRRAEAAAARRRRRSRRRAPSRKAWSPIRARPMSARSSASASRPSPAARSPTSTAWARRRSSRSPSGWRRSTAPASGRTAAGGDGGEGRDLLRPLRRRDARQRGVNRADLSHEAATPARFARFPPATAKRTIFLPPGQEKHGGMEPRVRLGRDRRARRAAWAEPVGARPEGRPRRDRVQSLEAPRQRQAAALAVDRIDRQGARGDRGDRSTLSSGLRSAARRTPRARSKRCAMAIAGRAARLRQELPLRCRSSASRRPAPAASSTTAASPPARAGTRSPFPASPTIPPMLWQVSGDSMLPLYRDGDIIIVSPTARIRRGDRVVVKTADGEVMAKILKRQSTAELELASFNPEHPGRTSRCARSTGSRGSSGRASSQLRKPDGF